MMKARTVLLVCVALQHLFTRCVDASGNSMAAAEQQQQGTLAGLVLGPLHSPEVIACNLPCTTDDLMQLFIQ
jgi:hypothetical protein